MTDERRTLSSATPPVVDDDVPRVAIVTGAGRRRGIGRAIAHRLAREGFAVVVHGRDRPAEPGSESDPGSAWGGPASVAEEIRTAGGRAVAVVGDLLDISTVDALVDEAVALGHLATVVNNAGTPGEANSYRAHETPDEVWDETIRVNLTSVHHVCRAAIPALAASAATNRSIVNISSTAAQRVLPWYGAYCASKAALERLTQQQAIELAPMRIRVNAIAPGSTSTDMIDGTLGRVVARTGIEADELRNAVLKRIPMRRFAEPAEIAAAVSFLAGDDATFVTGQILTVDGGMTLL